MGLWSGGKSLAARWMEGGKKKKVDERPKRAEFEYFCVFYSVCVCGQRKELRHSFGEAGRGQREV